MDFITPFTALLAFAAVPTDSEMLNPAIHNDMLFPTVYESHPARPGDFWLEALSPHPGIVFQMRIERRIRIRIPRLTAAGRSSDFRVPQETPVKWKTRKIGKCIAMNNISGVRITASENRLLLYMRDRRIIRADLDKTCNARSFYSGFYLEQSKDGKMCTRRDMLLARSGTKCEIDKLRQMVVDK